MDLFISKAYAAYTSSGSSSGSNAFDVLLGKILTNIVNPIVYLLFALAVVYFLFGVFTFIKNSEEPKAREQGQRHMIYGVIGVFIMISARGIINLILSTLGL